jgi:hypothetical protein
MGWSCAAGLACATGVGTCTRPSASAVRIKKENTICQVLREVMIILLSQTILFIRGKNKINTLSMVLGSHGLSAPPHYWIFTKVRVEVWVVEDHDKMSEMFALLPPFT